MIELEKFSWRCLCNWGRLRINRFEIEKQNGEIQSLTFVINDLKTEALATTSSTMLRPILNGIQEASRRGMTEDGKI